MFQPLVGFFNRFNSSDVLFHSLRKGFEGDVVKEWVQGVENVLLDGGIFDEIHSMAWVINIFLIVAKVIDDQDFLIAVERDGMIAFILLVFFFSRG